MHHRATADVARRRGRVDESMRELQAYYRLVGLPEVADAVETGYRAGGVEGAFRRAATRMEKLAAERFISPSEIAAAYARGAARDEAFEWLERAVVARDAFLWQLRQATAAGLDT